MYFGCQESGDAPDAELQSPLVFTFSSCETLLTACVKAFGQYGRHLCGSALYYLHGSYRLIIYPPPEPYSSACGPILCEYAHISGCGDLAAAYVAEHGKPIAEDNAIGKISYYLA